MRVTIARVTPFVLALLISAMLGCGSEEAAKVAVSGSPEESSPGRPGTNPDENPQPPEQPAPDPNHPVVKISTTMGDVVVEMDAELAPITVQNFLWYTTNGHYEGTIFHQVIDSYIVLGGGYTSDLAEKQTYFPIRNEADNGLKNEKYTIAMARIPDQIDSSTGQFFFNLADNHALDHKSRESAEEFGYCVFGKVISGAEVLDRISQVPVSNRDSLVSVPADPITITSVTQVY